MRPFVVPSLALLLLLQVFVGSDAQTTCIDDLSDIFSAEIAVTPDGLDTARVYVLCPNQDYVVKEAIEDLPLDSVAGQYALFMRSGATVKCGESGEVSNNCRITGGTVGASLRYLAQSDAAYPQSLVNARMQGLTFDGLTRALQIRGYAEGEVVLEDCLFTGMRSNFAFVLTGKDIITQGSANPLNDEGITECDLAADRGDFNITFVNSTFENNGQLVFENPSDSSSNLILTNCPGQTLVFIDSIFRNNNFARDEKTTQTALIAAFANKNGGLAGGIILERTCFFNNSLSGAYPVQGESRPGDTDFLVSIDTYVDETSIGDNPICEGFAIYNSNVETREVVECVEPGSSFCLLDVTESPTVTPTATPTTTALTTAPPTSVQPMTSAPTTSTSSATTAAIIGTLHILLLAVPLFHAIAPATFN